MWNSVSLGNTCSVLYFNGSGKPKFQGSRPTNETESNSGTSYKVDAIRRTGACLERHKNRISHFMWAVAGNVFTAPPPPRGRCLRREDSLLNRRTSTYTRKYQPGILNCYGTPPPPPPCLVSALLSSLFSDVLFCQIR